MSEVKERKLKIKFEYIVVILLVIAVVLVCGQTFVFSSQEQTTSLDYIENLENSMEQAISKISGVGSCRVFVYAKSGSQTIISTEKTTTVTSSGDSVTTEKPILVSGKPIVLQEIYPEITGVMIVAKGCSNPLIKMEILIATTTVFNISQDKVQILSQ